MGFWIRHSLLVVLCIIFPSTLMLYLDTESAVERSELSGTIGAKAAPGSIMPQLRLEAHRQVGTALTLAQEIVDKQWLADISDPARKPAAIRSMCDLLTKNVPESGFAWAISATGEILARNNQSGIDDNPENIQGHPLFHETQAGFALDGLWLDGQKTYLTGAVPLSVNGEAAGAVFIARPIDAKFTKAISQKVRGLYLTTVVNDRVVGTTLPNNRVAEMIVKKASPGAPVTAGELSQPIESGVLPFTPLFIDRKATGLAYASIAILGPGGGKVKWIASVDAAGPLRDLASRQERLMGLFVVAILLAILFGLDFQKSYVKPIGLLVEHLSSVQQRRGVTRDIEEFRVRKPFRRLVKLVNMTVKKLPSPGSTAGPSSGVFSNEVASPPPSSGVSSGDGSTPLAGLGSTSAFAGANGALSDSSSGNGAGLPAAAPLGDPGLPSASSLGDPGLPSAAPLGDPGLPAAGALSGLGLPAAAPLGDPGLPSAAPLGDPGLPSAAPLGDPGLPPASSLGDPGLPSAAPALGDPGLPPAGALSDLGLPTAAPLGDPGLPPASAPNDPGLPPAAPPEVEDSSPMALGGSAAAAPAPIRSASDIRGLSADALSSRNDVDLPPPPVDDMMDDDLSAALGALEASHGGEADEPFESTVISKVDDDLLNQSRHHTSTGHVLEGVSEEEEEHTSAAEQTMVATVPQELLQATANDPAVIPPPEEEISAEIEEEEDPEMAHFKETYNSFIELRQQCGEATSELSFERFEKKLIKNRDGLKSKYGCKSVRFQVYEKNGKAALKATPIRT